MLVAPVIKHWQKAQGFLQLSNKIVYSNDDFNSDRLKNIITNLTNKWPSLEKTTNIEIICDNNLNEEAYLLVVSEQGIKICSKTDVGAFYAVMTLKQLASKD